MSRRNRGNEQRSPHEKGSRDRVEQLISRRLLKDAFKQAKLCYRDEASPENHRLLERTYLLRIQELAQGGMSNAAAEVARHFLDFGVTDSLLLEDLVLVLPQLGLADQAVMLSGRIKSRESQANLALKQFDQAVVRPDRIAPDRNDLREGAERIRAALAALDAENESGALELLKDIPRSSPLADWRFFVRGLAAHRRGESAAALANWDRLDPSRAARRIVDRLRLTLNASRPDGGLPAAAVELSRLEEAVFGDAILGRLERLRRHLDPQDEKHYDWRKAIETLASLRRTLARVDIKLARRLTEILLVPLEKEAHQRPFENARRLINEFTAAAEPLPHDPHWNRFWALLWEIAGVDYNQARKWWQKYLNDLPRLTCLNLAQRNRAQALVWRRIAESYRNEAEACDEGAFDYDEAPRSRLGPARLTARAIEALEDSLRSDPTHRGAYEMLMECHEEQDDVPAFERAAERLLAAFPEDLPTIDRLIEHHLRGKNPERLLALARRARELKPLDSSYARHEECGHLMLARHRANEGDFEGARESLAAVERIRPAAANEPTILAKRAAIELNAGNLATAEALIDRAAEQSPDLAPLFLSLSLEAIFYRLPKPKQREFEGRFEQALRGEATSAAAGTLSRQMLDLREHQLDYAGRGRHEKLIKAYLRRAAKCRFEEADLRSVCRFLTDVEGEVRLRKSLINYGLKQFPDAAYYQLLSAAQQIRTTPSKGKLKSVIQKLQRAHDLAVAGKYPADLEYLSEIRELLDVANSLNKMFGGFARGGFGLDFLPNFPGGFAHPEFDEDPDDDGYAEGFGFAGLPFGRRSTRPGRKRQ